MGSTKPVRRRPQGKVITSLASLPSAAFLDERALAIALGCSKRTLRRMAARQELPPAIRLGGRATWQAGRVVAWITARCEHAERLSGAPFVAASTLGISEHGAELTSDVHERDWQDSSESG